MYFGFHIKYPSFLYDFDESYILVFSEQIFGNFQISNFMKIRPEGAELFRTNRRKEEQIDGQTDRHNEINSRFLAISRTRPKYFVCSTRKESTSPSEQNSSTGRAVDCIAQTQEGAVVQDSQG